MSASATQGGHKEEERRRRNHRTKIQWPALLHRVAIISVNQQSMTYQQHLCKRGSQRHTFIKMEMHKAYSEY